MPVCFFFSRSLTAISIRIVAFPSPGNPLELFPGNRVRVIDISVTDLHQILDTPE